MQWPPTKARLEFWKFHFGACRGKHIPKCRCPFSERSRDSSFMNAILRSRCAFSMTFAASATLIDGARWMPALDTEP